MRNDARRAGGIAAVGAAIALASTMLTAAAPGARADVSTASRAGSAHATRTGPSPDWPRYLNSPAHSSFNIMDSRIRPAYVGGLVQKWHFVGDAATMPGQPGPSYVASPIVADGAVYIGSETGWFYKLDEWTGAVLAKVFLGFQRQITCDPGGIASTAAVVPDPADGQLTAYVAAPDGYLYALRASDLSQKWRSVIAIPSTTVNDYYQWSSPTVVNGKIYVGVASSCDQPLVPGELIGYDQATGAKFATFSTMPPGQTGGTIWSSAAVDTNGYVYVTTGNPQYKATGANYSNSIVKLDPNTLKPLASFTVPAGQSIGDGDFGASPTVFGRYVGACNKNGVFYALYRSTMARAWQTRVSNVAARGSQACLAAAADDNTYIYVAGPATTINGTSYLGSVQRLNVTTGAPVWQTGLPNCVIGSPTMNDANVMAVGTFCKSATPDGIYLLNTATGQVLRELTQGSPDFAQSVFANGWLFTADGTGVTAWGLARDKGGA